MLVSDARTANGAAPTEDIGRIIRRRLEAGADKLVVRILDASGGSVPVTGGILLERAARYATAFTQRSEPGEVVGVCLYHGIDLYAAFVGGLWAGRVPTMLPPPSPRIEPSKYARSIRHMLEHVRPAAVVMDSSVQSALAGVEGAAGAAATHLISPETLPPTGDMPGVAADPNDIAVLQHSSGTTGLQKGVALSHRAILAHNERYIEALRITQDDRIVSWLPLYHDMGFIACFLLPLLNGIEIVAMSQFDWVRAPTMLLTAITEHSPTLCWLPNFAFPFLARAFRPGEKSIDLSSIRAWVNCSEPVTAAAHARFLERFEKHGASRAQLTASYAMAENVFAVTQSRPGEYAEISLDSVALRAERRVVRSSDPRALRLASNGPPMRENEIKIIDDAGNYLADGLVGEIAIRSPHTFAGYFRRDDLTALVLSPDGWFGTGDVGFLDSGELFVTSRKKDLIIIQGRNFYPTDFEDAAGGVEGVAAGRVVAFGLADAGTATEGLVIIAEVRDEAALPATDLGLAIRSVISQTFDCTPSVVKLVPPRWLIKSTSGKIARNDNREKYLASLGFRPVAAVV